MMEIVYGPVVLTCGLKGVAAGLLGALFLPWLLHRLGWSARSVGASGRIGFGLLTGGLFGIFELVMFCAGDGFPPRILQSTGVAMLLLAAVGATLLWGRRRVSAQH